MKCKKHPTHQSNSVGVCASCLRQRLVAIIAAQAQAQLNQAPQDCRKSDVQSLEAVTFPRSVSPYISRRKSESTTATWQPHDQRRFYSTPQLGPNGSIAVEFNNNNKKSSKGGRFASLLGIFRSKSDVIPDRGVSIDSCSASSSWFSNIFPRRNKKKIRAFSIDESTLRNRGRGMSPARHADNEDDHRQSSGYSSDSQGWRQTPRRTPVTTRRVASHSKSVSGFAFCLSPLVRPSPNHHWSQKLPPEMVVGGESRTTPKPASFCKNRSRKLADLGRYTYDHTY